MNSKIEIKKKVCQTLQRHHMLDNCRHILVGISGGADSLCLLLLLKEILQEYPHISLSAVHINHMLRGEAADQDAAQVMQLCKAHQIPLLVRKCKVADHAVEHNLSIEMAGRELRYAVFQEISGEYPDCKIAVAHNQEDRGESILFHVMRGTGLEGLKGIPYTRDNIIRPLLDCTKAEIRSYCESRGEQVCEDASNSELIYTRNRIRLECIPYINQQFGIDLTSQLIRMSENLSIDAAFIQDTVREVFPRICQIKSGKGDTPEYILQTGLFLEQHPAIQVRILQNICGNGLEKTHLDALLSFISKTKTGQKVFCLPKGMEAVKGYETVIFRKERNNKHTEPFSYTLQEHIAIQSLGLEICCRTFPADEKLEHIDNLAFHQRLDYDKINSDTVFRNRQEGDWIRPYKGAGVRTIKKYMIDHKIPAEERDQVLLLASGSQIYWIVGHRLGEDILPDAETKTILEIKIRKF